MYVTWIINWFVIKGFALNTLLLDRSHRSKSVTCGNLSRGNSPCLENCSVLYHPVDMHMMMGSYCFLMSMIVSKFSPSTVSSCMLVICVPQ